MEATPPTPPQQPGGAPPQYPAGPAGGAQLDTASTFESVFKVYGAQFTVLLGAALIVFVPIAILNGAVGASDSVALALVTSVIGLVGQALYTGAVVEAVRDIRDGRRDFSVGDLLRAAVPFIVPLILAGILFGVIFVVGLLIFIIPGLVFLTWFCLIAPAIVVERQGVFEAFGRSRDLVRGNGWRVFGVLVVTVVIAYVVGTLIQRIAFGISDDFFGALVGGLISNLITAPLFGVTVSVLYFALRDLKEGTRGMYGTAPPPSPGT